MVVFFLKQLRYIICIIGISFFISHWYTTEESTIKNILKVKTYTLNDNGSFVFSSYGSAIAITTSRILTNAHVVLDNEGNPTGRYEICVSRSFESVPFCNNVARLIAYDVVADLALLELVHDTTLVPFSLSHKKIAIGSYVSMYGYPGIWGETITRTEWKIAGYEQGMYKIDGSIDHGNSGWWAFNNSGELLGMPTAVASDNASIGYMIPVKRIEEFLMKKTPSYEIYTEKMDHNFIDFIEQKQSYLPGASKYSFKNIFIKNPRPYGFQLKSTMMSRDKKMLYWTFSDAYDRVKFNFVCTDDAWKVLGWQARLSGIVEEQKLYPNWDIRAIDDPDFLTVYSSAKWYNPSIVVYYKKYDACYIDMDYPDIKKDSKSLERALRFVKQAITFRERYILKSEQQNAFFSVKNTNANTRIIRSIDKNGAESLSLWFEIEKGKWLNGSIEWKKYSNLSDLWVDQWIDFSLIKTWNDYIALGVKNGIESDRITTVSLWTSQQGVVYSSYNPEKKITTFNFEYMYQLVDGTYGYWNWSASVSWDVPLDISAFSELFWSLEYKWQSLLK